jgi:uncharacterized protein (DUF486 family)
VRGRGAGSIYGNWSSPFSFTTIAANHAPTLTLTSTSGSSVPTGQLYTIVMRAADVDGNLTNVDVNWNDGTAVEHKTVSGSSQSVTFSRSFSTVRTINWSANAYDATLLASNTLTGSFNVTANAPTLTLTSTSGASVPTGQPYSITVSAADVNANLSNVDVNWNDGTAVERKFVSGSSASVTFTRTYSTARTINWSANAYDTTLLASNTLSGSFNVTPVNHAPTLTLTSTSGGSVPTGQLYTIVMSATDVDGNLTNVDVNWNDGTAVEHKTVSGSSQSVTFTRSFSTAQTINWSANAYDATLLASNTLTGSFNVTANAPTLTLTSTSGASVPTGQPYSITVSAADVNANLSNVDVNWNDGTAVEHKTVSGSSQSVTFTRSFSTVRTINWSANAYDTTLLASNTLTGSFNVTAVNHAPTLALTSTSGASVPTGQLYTIVMSASDVDGNLTNVDVNWNDGMAVEHKTVSGSQQSVTFTRSFSTVRTINWSANAYDTTLLASNTLTGSFNVTAVNHAPTLALTSSSGGSVPTGQLYTIVMSASDVDGNLTNVDVNWNDGTAVEHKTVSGSQQSVTFTRSFSTARSINWSANAYDTTLLASNPLFGSFSVSPPAPPTAMTQAATYISQTSFQMNGLINPNGVTTQGYFEWGTSPTLNSSIATSKVTIGFGTTDVPRNSTSNGKTCNTIYYYRMVAEPTGGSIIPGNILSVTTAACAASSCDIPALTVLTDRSLEFDEYAMANNGHSLIESRPGGGEIDSKIQCLREMLPAGSFEVTSQWRPAGYQHHFKELIDKYIGPPGLRVHNTLGCQALYLEVKDHYETHGLGTQICQFDGACPHPEGRAFDAAIPVAAQAGLANMAMQCNLYRPLRDSDGVHFELIKKPVIGSLSPTTSGPRNSPLVITINGPQLGSKFFEYSEVRWNGEPRPTTYISRSKLKVTIPASDLTTPGTFQIEVFNPNAIGSDGMSEPKNFVVASQNLPIDSSSTVTSPNQSGVSINASVIVKAKKELVDGNYRYTYQVINNAERPVSEVLIGMDDQANPILDFAPVGWNYLDGSVPNSSYSSPSGWEFALMTETETDSKTLIWAAPQSQNHIANGTGLSGFSILVPEDDVTYLGTFSAALDNGSTVTGNIELDVPTPTPTPTRTLTVASSNPSSGVSITVSPNDNNGQGGDNTPFARVYNNNTNMSLTAPSTAGGNTFQKWQLDGVDLQTSLLANFVMDANHTITAVYVPPCASAQMTSPTNSSNIQSTTTFAWNTGTNNAEYWLQVGTTVGGSNIYSASQLTGTTRTLSNLPSGPIYVRLSSRCSGTNAWSFNDYSYTGPTACAAAQMTNPMNGASILSTTTFTWNTGTNNAEYWLQVGTTVGGGNIYSASQLTGTTRTLSNLPSGPIYVRLSSRCSGTNAWSFNDYSYTGPAASCAAAQMTNPTNGASIAASTTFTWNTGTGNAEYWLQVGTTVGGSNIYSGSQLTGTSRTLSNLPSGPIYVRLSSRCASTNVWSFNDYSYTGPVASCTTAQMTSPANGASISSSTTFNWNTGTGNAEYWLQVGTTVGGGNIYSASQLTGTSRTLSNLPGGNLYVRLSSRCSATNSWSFNDYSYVGNDPRSQMLSPAGGAFLPSSNVTFTWTRGTGVSQNFLYVGNTPGSSEYFYDYITDGSTTVSGIPTDGRTIYVRLWSLPASGWTYLDYSYTACLNCGSNQLARITSPFNGTTFSSSAVTFNWNVGTGNSQYFLYVGNSQGSSEYLYSSISGGSSAVSGLPTDGRALWVRIWSFNGQWLYLDYVYKATG